MTQNFGPLFQIMGTDNIAQEQHQAIRFHIVWKNLRWLAQGFSIL